MNDQLPRYRYWGDRKPDARLATLAVRTAKNLEALDLPDETGALQPGDQPTVAVLRLYAPIDSWGGWWGINDEEVSVALDALPSSVETIILRLNSPGGEVPTAMAILNLFRAHKARIIAVVDGWAVSAASFIAVGADETVMSPGTTMMIHDARIFAYGDPASLRKTADRMDKDSDSIASIYAAKAGGDEAAWRALMGPETWYTAKEAAEAGLADRVDVVPDAGITDTPGTDPTEETDSLEGDGAENVFDLSMYRYAGRAHAPAPAAIAATKPPSAAAAGSPKKEGASLVDFTDEQIATLREQVGFPEDADAATITAAVEEALTERAEPTTPEASGARVPEGSVVVSKAEWEEMRGDATRGAEAAKRLHVKERSEALNRLRDRFLPANRKSWEEEYDRNPKATIEALEQRPVVIPLDEVGYDLDDNDTPAPKSLDEVRNDPDYQTWSVI